MTDRVIKWIGVKNGRARVRKKCPFGMVYFCDGTVNRAEMKERVMTKREPCQYLENGKCNNRACKLY